MDTTTNPLQREVNRLFTLPIRGLLDAVYYPGVESQRLDSNFTEEWLKISLTFATNTKTFKQTKNVEWEDCQDRAHEEER